MFALNAVLLSLWVLSYGQEDCEGYAGCCSSPSSEECANYCKKNCSDCIANKKKDACGPGAVCDLIRGEFGTCRKPGNGQIDSFCGQTGDAPCQATLSCRMLGSVDICGGNGSTGAHCGRVRDATCPSSDVCDGICVAEGVCDGICRAKGTGADQQPCNPRDTPCKDGLTCDLSDVFNRKCRPIGNGVDGAVCGSSSSDRACNPGLACDAVDYKCRSVGHGAVNDGCGTAKDDPCTSPLTCDVLTRKCRAAGDGSPGAKCGMIGADNTCLGSADAPAVCDSDNKTCRTRGTGAEGQLCKSEDSSCTSPLTCDSFTKKCRARGNGAPGADCDPNGYGSDDSCSTNLVCSAERKCVGTGATGASCGRSGDAACGADTFCDAAQTCSVFGAGAVDEPCGSAGDAPCASGTCGADNVCVAAKGAANSIYIPSFLIALLVAFLFL